MKRSLKILLVVSFVFNLALGSVFFYIQWRTRLQPLDDDIQEVDIKKERQNFLESVFHKHPELRHKKAFFMNIWYTGDWESIKDMPKLDTLIEPINPELAYLFVTEEKADYAWRKIKEHTTKTKHFVYISDQKNFITSILQEKGLLNKKPYKWHHPPLNIIMTPDGNIRFFNFRQFVWRKSQAPPGKSAPQTFDSLEKLHIKRYFYEIDSALFSLR